MTESNRNNEPILPGIGLAGISLGQKIEECIAALGQQDEIDNAAGNCSIRWGPVVAVFDCSKTAVELIAELGYSGEVSSGISPGVTWNEIISRLGSMIFDEDFHIWIAPHLKGLGFEIVVPSENATPLYHGKWELQDYQIQQPSKAIVFSIRVF